jgi:hypothetical protein
MFSGGCRFPGSSFWQEKEEQKIIQHSSWSGRPTTAEIKNPGITRA